jgi:hypothetical protein
MHNIYTFRPIEIDGIYCYLVIYANPKVLNIESLHIHCKIKTHGQYSQFKKENYSLYHYAYETIESAIVKAKQVISSFRVLDGDLISPRAYRLAMLEADFIPYKESQNCSVCFRGTLDTTLCGHSLCFHCRQSCVMREMLDCPICREPNIVQYYNIENGLLNNSSYSIVIHALNGTNNIEYTSEVDEDDDDDEDDEDEDTVVDADSDENITIHDSSQDTIVEMETEETDEETEILHYYIDRTPTHTITIVNDISESNKENIPVAIVDEEEINIPM